MDRVLNPFAPGAGNPPPELAGRAPLLEDAETILKRAAIGRPTRSMILVGLRGVGKTVLLNRVRHMAQDSGFSVISIEAHEGKPLAELLIPPLREILFSLSQLENAKELARRGLRVLRGFVGALNVAIDGSNLWIDRGP